MVDIFENWRRVQAKITQAAHRVGRDPAEIQIVAVSKTVAVPQILTAIHAGVKILGENRVQEARHKYQQLGKIVHWHLVGHLQTNKVKNALEVFEVIHSVDSFHLAEEINRRCHTLSKTVEILVEVKTSDENTKYGVAPERCEELIGQIAMLPNIKIIGLMTVGKWSPVEVETRHCFQRLAALRDQIQHQHLPGVNLHHLSMGMSGDFVWAIEEGATMVRIGTAIFGARPI